MFHSSPVPTPTSSSNRASRPNPIEPLEPRTLLSAIPHPVSDPLPSEHPPIFVDSAAGLRLLGAAANQPPTAIAIATPRRGNLPLTVNFDATPSTDPDGDTLRYRWNFADGTPVFSGAVLQHTFVRAGRYPVRLTVFDGNGNKDSQIIVIRAGNQAPRAVAAASPIAGEAPLTVNFDGSGSTDPDGDTLKFRWRFGDGTRAHSAAPTHTYTRAGRFIARLTVFDGNGNKNSDRIVINVGDTPPSATIILPTAGTLYQANSVIRFSGFATDREDGSLDARRFTWRIDRVIAGNSQLQRVFVNTRNGRFTIPANLPGAPNQFFRITLTVRDSSGQTDRERAVIRPRLADLNLQTNFAGLRLLVDRVRFDAPASVSSPVGFARRVTAPAQQVVDGVTYVFDRWSDAGARSHTVAVGLGGTSLLAIYRVVP